MLKNINNLIKTTSKQNTLFTHKYHLHNKLISHITYNIDEGEINYINVNENFRSIGIGKKMLYDCILDMKNNNISTIYCFTYLEHPFWSNIYNKKFKFTWIEEPKYYNASTYDMYDNYGKYEMKI